MARPRNDADKPAPRRPPATTPQARENQLISLAYDEAEKQIRSGKATSQLLTHFLKLGTAKEGLERQELEAKVKLLDTRVESMASNSNTEKLYADAIAAMSSYQTGEEEEPDFD